MLKNKYISNLNLFSFRLIFLILFSILYSQFISAQVNVTAAALTTSGDPYPSDGMCPASGITIQVKVVNNGGASHNCVSKPITVDVTISGPVNQSFSTVINTGSISIGGSRYVNVSTTADLSVLGNYTIDMSATCTGDASPGTDATEIVGVTGNNIALTSALSTAAQTVCLNSPIVDITYDVSDNATDATASGLPAGLTATFNYPTLTISGSPTTNTASPYSYTVTATGTCPGFDSTLAGTVTITSLPTVSITGASAICIASTTNLSPNAGGTWISSDNLIATVTNAGLVTGVSAGSATFTFTDGSTGCSNTTVTSVDVSAPPTTGVLSGNQAICSNGSTTFSSTVVGGSWSSSNDLIATVVTGTGVISGVSAGTATMTYTVTGTGGCSDATDTRTVTLTAPPDPGTLSGTQAICNPGTTVFTSTIPGGTWLSATPAVAIIDGVGNIAAVTAGTSSISYTVTGSGGCADSSATRVVTVTDPPTTGVLSGTQLICETGNTTFSSTVNGGTWTSSDVLTATIDLNSGVIDGVAAGTATMTYTVTGTGGCADVTDSRSVTISPLPDPGVLSGTNAVCLGDVSTFSSTVAGGAWASATPLVATIDANSGAIATLTVGSSIMTYTVSGSNECAGFTNSDTRTLTVTAPPSAGTLSGNQDICANGSTTFTPTIAGGSWSTSDPTIATVVGGSISGVGGGTATITYTITGTGGCTDVTTTRDVNVTAIPTAGTLSGSQAVCVSGSSTFSSDVPGGSWASNDNTIATITPTGDIAGVSAGSAIMTYTVTGTGGCSDVSDTRSVTVSNAPSAGVLSGSQTICAGGTTTFSSSVAGGTWSSGTPGIATIDSNTGDILGVSAGSATMTYTITGTGGCSDVTNTRTVTVKANPTVLPITGLSTLCVGDLSSYTDATNGGTWSSSDPMVLSIDNFGSSTALTSGNVTLSYTVTSNGCTTIVSQLVDVYDLPTVNPISGTTTVCAGSSTPLSSTTPGGTWSTDDNSIATVSALGVVTGVAGGTTNINYAVTSNGCTTTQSVSVTVVPLPTVAAISGTNTVCEGGTTQLSIITGGGSWSTADVSTATVDASGLVHGVTAGSVLISYSVTSGGCTNSSSVNITVLSSPSVNATTGSNAICIGDFTPLSNTTPGGVWSSDNYGIADISVAGVVEGISAGTCNLNYSVTSGSCTSVATFAMTVNDFPVVPEISGSSFVCVSATSNLSNTVAGGTWSSSNTGIATINPTTGVVTGVSAGSSTISYAVTTNGCTTTKNLDITVNTLASLGAISGSNSICAGASTTLSNVTAGGTWTSSNTGVATIDPSSGVLTGVSAGSSTITYAISSGGCNSSTTFSITILPVPIVNAITGLTSVCTGNTITLANTTVGGTWSTSDNLIATISAGGVLTGVSAGSVNALYSKTSGGCTTTQTYAITVNSTPSIQPITGTTSICMGSATTLNSTTVGGTWSSGSTGVATINSSTGVVNSVSVGSSLITYSVTIGSCSNAVNTTVTVNAMPTVNPISGLNTVCVGDNITLTNSTPGGTWSSSNTGIASITSGGVVLGVSAGSSIITYSVTSNGCTTNQTLSLTVNAYPTVNATTGTANVCVGSTVQLTNTTLGGAWSTSNAAIATTNAFGLVTGVSAGTTNINYTVTNGSCSSVAAFAVTVNAALSVSSIIGTTDICIGANSQLTNVTNGGTWSSSNTGVATVNASGLVTSVSVGSTTIRYDVVTNGVCPQFASVTFTVNQIPTVNAISDISACQNSTISAINFTGTGSPVFNWTNTNTNIGLSAIGTGDISSFTASGTTIGSASEIAVIDVTPVANGCSGTSKQFLITVNSLDNAGFSYSSNSYCHLDADPSPSISGLFGGTFTSSSGSLFVNTTTGIVDLSVSTPGYYQITYTTSGSCPNDSTIDFSISNLPTINAVSDQQSCDGSSFSAINFSGSLGTIFTWTNSNTSVGLASSGSGNISSFTAGGTTPGGSSISSTVVVTPISGSCIGTKDTFLLTVKAKDNATFTYPSNSFCSTLDPNPIANITGRSGGTFTMSPTGATFNANTGLITLSSSNAGSYVLKYTTNGSCPNIDSVSLTIGSNPSVNAISSQSICSGSSFNAINFSGTTGTTFNWTSSNASLLGLAASGSGNIASFVGSGATSGTPTVTSTITVTPTIGSCTGSSKTFTLSVKYKDDVSILYDNTSYCSSNSDPSPSITGTSGGVFSATPVGLILNTSTGKIDINASSEGVYDVKYITSGTCGDTAVETIGINNSPSVNNVADQTVCAGNNFASISFSGTAGTVYHWTNSNTAIGLAASGTGDISSFTAINSTNSQISATITITPKSGACTGAVKTFSLKVNPSESANFSYASTTACQSGSNLSPTISGTTGGAFSSNAGLSINASTGVINPSTSTPGTYNVIYRTGGICFDVSSNLVTIIQTPTVNSVSDVSVCQNTMFDPISFSGSVGNSYNWTNSNTSIGLASSGSGNIASFMASGTTLGSVSVSSVVTVTPSIGICTGVPKTFILTTNSIDNPAFNYSSASFCLTESNPSPTITGKTGGSFTVLPNTGLSIDGATGTIDLSSSTAGTYAVTYTTNGFCQNDSAVSISIGSFPTVTAVTSQTVCQNSNFSDIIFSGAPGTVFNWTNSNTAIGLASSGSGNISAFSAAGTTIGGSNQTATIIVTPTIGTCVGTTSSFTLTVKPLDNPAFSYSNSSYCKNQSNPTPSITGLTGGTFSSLPVGLSMNSVGTINLATSTSGNYTISYTTHGQCPNVSTSSISIGSSPTVNAISDQSVCAGSSFSKIDFTGNAGTIFNWTNTNTAIGLAASGTGNINSFVAALSGTSVVVVTPIIGTCAGTSKTFTLTVNSVQTSTIQYGQSSYCTSDSDPTPIQTGPINGVYSSSPAGLSINSSTGLINLNQSTAGTYTINYTLSASCSTSSSTVISVGSGPTVNAISSQSICNGASFSSINFTGSAGSQFNWVNNNTNIGLLAIGSGNISGYVGVNATNANIISTITVTPVLGSCTGTSKSFTLTIKPSDNPTFVYSTANYCHNDPDPSPMITGTSGGIFTSSPIGLSLNSSTGKINIGASSANTYNVTYLTGGSCPQVSTKTITINPTPFVNNVTISPKCQGTTFSSTSFTGSSNTTFNWSNSNTSIGLGASGIGILPSFVASGTTKNGNPNLGIVTVIPSINGCTGSSMSFSITVNSLDDASFNYSKNSICQNDGNPVPTISGTKNGVFTSTPSGLSLNSSTGRISIGSSTVGSYNIKYTTTGSCPYDSTVSIVINPQPSVNTVSNQQRCFGDSFNPIAFSGSSNTIFNWTNDNASIGLTTSGVGDISAFIAKGTVFGGSAINGNVVITPEINGCYGSTKSFVLTVNPIDNPAFHFSDDSYCTTQANPSPIIDGTNGGVFSSTPVGLSINSSTGQINLLSSTAGVYLIKYTTPGNCKDDSTVTIGVGSNPSVNDVDDQSYCQGDMFDDVIFTGNPGTIFNWINSNNAVGLPSSGHGNIKGFKADGTVDGGSDASATITVTPRIGTCIGTNVNFKYKVRANPNIVASISNTSKKDTSYCKGGSVVLSATGASKNENYIWTPHTSLAGNNGIGATVTTKTDTTQQYIVRGQSQFGCFNYDTLFVYVYNPLVYQKNDTTLCSGSQINNIVFKGNLTGTSFNWSNSNANIGIGFNGVDLIPSFKAVNNTNSTKQTATISVTPKYLIQSLNQTCSGPVMKFTISVNKQDDPSFNGYQAQYCANEVLNTKPTITGVTGGIFSANPTGLALNSNTGEIFPVSSKAGSYSIKYTTNGVCPKSDSVFLFVNPLINATISGADTVCVNAVSPQIKFKGTNGVAPYKFSYKLNGGTIQTISSDPGKDEVSIPVSTNKGGIFTYELISVEESSSSQCVNTNVTGIQTVIVNELPNAQITSTSASVCAGATNPEIRITGLNGVSPFTFTYFVSKDGNPFGTSQTVSSKQGEYLVKIPVSTTDPGSYNYTVNLVQNGDHLSCKNNINVSSVITIKPLPTGTVTVAPTSICMNGVSNINFTATNGLPPFTFVYTINDGGSQTIKTLTNSYTAQVKANTSFSGNYTIKVLSITDSDATSCVNNNVNVSTVLTITPGTKVDKIQDINVCVNELSDTIEFTGGPNGTIYNWYSNNTTIGISGSGTGNIYPFKSKNTSGSSSNVSRITVVPSLGQCKGDSMKFDIVIRPKPNAKILGPNNVCPGDSIRLEGVGSELKYIWTPNVTCITCNPVIAKPTESTSYKAFVTDKYNCFDSTEHFVYVYRKPEIKIDEPVLCGEPDSVMFVGKGENMTYTYSDGIKDSVLFLPSKGTSSYLATVTDINGCKNKDTVHVYVVDKPKSNFVTTPETGLASDLKPLNVLLTNKSTNASAYEWYFRNGDASPLVKTTNEPVTALYKKPGIYVVTLVAKNGKCIDSSSFSIKIEKLDTPRVEIAPNVFTPDNDGINDVFFLTVKNAKNIHISIYNRWGNPIHEITETTQSWDGRINGKDADEGVYYYQYEIEGSSGEKIKGQGFVQLIRH